jgi:hypothetical protein
VKLFYTVTENIKESTVGKKSAGRNFVDGMISRKKVIKEEKNK